MSTFERAAWLRTAPCLAAVAAVVAVAGLSLTGCGQKGPLYLPDTPAPSVPSAASPAAPAPDAGHDATHPSSKTQKPDHEPQS